ncbi:hypothetical protein C810_05004 [Lachnospiraceae bacterium A2]|nr:hypothetical protein C810_05004 [Lachnospiraceae bacterium A2]
MKKFLKSTAVALFLCWISSIAVFAAQGKIDQVQEDIEGLEKQKEQAKEKAKSWEGEASSLEGDLKEFNNSLASAVAELNETEQKLASTRDSLAATRKDLAAAREKEKEQYASMKKRIQFMYEMDMEGMLEVLLSAENFADFLSKGEYIISIHNYDREMLEEYRNTKEEIAGKEQKLTEDEKLLADLQAQQEGKKQELAALVDSTSDKLGAAKKQLAAAQADVEAYEAEIQQQKAYEAELEKQKAAEDAKRMEEIKRQEEEMRKKQLQNNSSSAGGIRDSSSAGGTSGGNAGGSSGNGSNSGSGSSSNGSNSGNGSSGNGSNSGSGSSGGGAQGSSSDLTLLAALIQCEAGGESYEGKLAVGSVVMNRVSSSHFPNTVAGVIYQGGQFSPVASGRFASVLAKGADRSCTQAASEVLGGNITIGTLYFRVNDGSIPGTVIGNHVFY